MIKTIVDNGRKLLFPKYRMRLLYEDFDPSDPPVVAEGGKRILFIPWYAREVYLLRETFMAKACEYRGATTALLHCDVRIAPTENGELARRYGVKNPELNGAEDALRHLNQAQLLASDFRQPFGREGWRDKLERLDREELLNFSYRGVKVGDLAMASAIRITLGMGPEWDNPEFMESVTGLLLTSIELIELFDRVYDHFRPDRVCMSHGIYVTWGVAYRLARKRGIDVVVYNGSYRRDTLRFYHNATNAPFPVAEWPRFRDKELTASERQWAETYFRSRADLSGEMLNIFSGSNDPERIQRFVTSAKEDGKTLAALFTNMSWDAYAFSDQAVFADMVDWANQTLEYARGQPDLRLIFKIHPAEDYFKVPEKYRLRNHLVAIPDNVLLVTEMDKVKPFTFFNDIDFGLINISTVAIEMALLGIPVLTSGGNGHYEGHGFTLSPQSRDDYFEQLDRLVEGKSTHTPDREMALRYLHYRFYREAIPFRAFETNNHQLRAIGPKNYDDLRPGKNPGLDTIAEGILHGTPFIYPVDPPAE